LGRALEAEAELAGSPAQAGNAGAEGVAGLAEADARAMRFFALRLA
jgi:hypothetical protein